MSYAKDVVVAPTLGRLWSARELTDAPHSTLVLPSVGLGPETSVAWNESGRDCSILSQNFSMETQCIVRLECVNKTRPPIQHHRYTLEKMTIFRCLFEYGVQVARTGLQQESGSLDRVPVFVSNEQKTFEGLSRETGVVDVDLEMMFELKLMVQALDMSEGEPTE
ncbi:hypothetical protein MMC22_003898 [Lobaria immixta]|nr:hypothetical protein [Lobaria immixta]